jgi:phage-related protein
MIYFETFFLPDAIHFIETLDPRIIKKIFYTIDLAQQTNDTKIFKKIRNDIWEFKTQYLGVQIRLLAFWDKMDNKKALVITSNGFVKKTEKTPNKEIKKAIQIREQYLNKKSSSKKS